jgi:hypothetical protein
MAIVLAFLGRRKRVRISPSCSYSFVDSIGVTGSIPACPPFFGSIPKSDLVSDAESDVEHIVAA